MSVTCDRSVVFSGLLHQLNWPPQYSWNIVESGVRHHNPNTVHIKHFSPARVKLDIKSFLTLDPDNCVHQTGQTFKQALLKKTCLLHHQYM